MESDREWTARVWSSHDADRGPVTEWLIRARFPGGRWRSVSRVGRAPSAEEQHTAIARECSSLSEPHIEVQAFTARARQPESTRAPWTSGASHDTGSGGGVLPDINTEADPQTVVFQFAASSRAMYELERRSILEMLERQARQAREDADHWRQVAFKLAASQGESGLQVVESVSSAAQVDHTPLAAQVIGGLQSVAAMVMAGMAGTDGEHSTAMMMTARAFFDGLSPEQLQGIANLLTTQQQAQLLLLAELVTRGGIASSQPNGHAQGEVVTDAREH